MSANFYFAARYSQKDVPLKNKATFQKAMEKCFGERPWTLTEKHLPILKGMQSAMDEDEAFEKIVRSIEEAEAITINYSY